MTSFEEIKNLFTSEIISSPQYQVALKIKEAIKADIGVPNINYVFTYKLTDDDYVDIKNRDKEDQILIMALKLILGIDVEISYGYIIVIMSKFLKSLP